MDNLGGGGGWPIWRDDEVEELARLWDEGWTASEIARKLKRTRGSIMGKVDRIDLPPRQKNEHLRIPKRKHTPRVRVERMLERIANIAMGPPSNDPLDIWAIGENQCRWPKHGSGAAQYSIAAPADGSWCPYHERIVWRQGG